MATRMRPLSSKTETSTVIDIIDSDDEVSGIGMLQPHRVNGVGQSSPDRVELASGDPAGQIELEAAGSEVDDSDLESDFEIDSAYELPDASLQIPAPDQCTAEEAVTYRELLVSLGPEEFIKQTLDTGTITARKLITAFGLRAPPKLEGYADGAYYSLLGLGISRELSKRAKLKDFNTIDDVVELLKTRHNIIVLTGAGISTSLGIPDFRSKGTGLYDTLGDDAAGVNEPHDVFNIEIFKEDPTIFFRVAKKILPEGVTRTTPTHKFIELLQSKGKLLTQYTQNIDNIETAVGILPEKLVQCHGSFATATCMTCKDKIDGELIFDDIRASIIPRCKRCMSSLHLPHRKRKRSRHSQSGKRRRNSIGGDTSSEDDMEGEGIYGIMKPDITFFGEALPSDFSDRLVNHDKGLVDLVIIIGTSLKVAPVSEVIPYLDAHVPQIFISRDPVSHHNFDVDMLGDCDIVVAELCRRAGWKLDHDMVPKDQVVDVKLQEGYPSRYTFTRST